MSKVQRNRGGVWIDLQGGLVLHIAPRQLGSFDLNMFSGLEGRQVEVRGWVLDRSQKGGRSGDQARWMLRLTHPGMLRVLSN